MKEGWKEISINDACIQMNGIWKGTKEPLIKAKILRTTNFSKDCLLKLDDLAVIDVEKKKFEAKKLSKGDIIIERSGGGPKQPVGRVVLFDLDDTDYSFCNFTSALRIKDPNSILPKYLHKYLTFLYFSGATEKYQSNLVGFRNLDFKGYVSMTIRYPSLPEQQRIVDILDAEFDKIDALKANAEKNLQNAKDLFQAALKKELSCEKYHLLLDNYEIETGKLNSNAAIENGKYPFFTCSREVFSINSYAFDCDAILLAGNNASGDFNVKHYNGKFNAYQRTYVITSKNQLANIRLLYYVMTYYLSELKKMSLGINTKFLKKGMIENVKIPSFSLKKADSVVCILDKLSENCKQLQSNYEKTIALCDDMKQALLRKAFNGEL